MDLTIAEVRDRLSRQPVPGMAFGPGGTVVDKSGRLICTFNLRDLTLGEAFTLAQMLIVAADAIGAPDPA
jgi:hypothetical protein